MAWLEKIGVKGIKVDFFGGDKQLWIRCQINGIKTVFKRRFNAVLMPV